MVSSLTQSKLVSLLQTIAKGEQDRESSRLSLTKNYSFESYVAFKRLDRYSDNSLSIGEVINFLKDNRIQVHEKELRPFFEVYSCKGGVRLTYTDFQKIVLPKTNGLLKHQCLGRKVQALAGDEYLDPAIEKALSSLIHSEVVFLQQIESLKEELATRHDFGLLDAFKLIDEENRGSLDFTSVYNFLEKNGRVTKTDVEALFTRFDKNRDQELSYSEFVQLLQPINPNCRVSLRSPSPVRKSTSRPASPRVSSPKRKEANPYVAEFVSTPVKSKRQTEEDNYKDYLRETAAKSQSSYTTPVRSPKVNTFEEAISPSRTLRSTYSAYQSPISEKKHTYGDGFLSLGNTEKRELARFLKDQLDLDRNLEKSKKELVGQRRFDSAQLFKVFDPENKGYFTRGQLEAGLKEFNIFPSKNELYLLMRVLDKNGDGLVRYREFKEEIEPRDHKSVFSSDKQDDISYEVRRLLRRLLNQIISNELRCEELRRNLNKRMHFTVFEAFTNLKKSYTEFVTAITFKDLLNEQGIFASIEDCELLVIRYDRNKNGRVSYSEFVNEMVQKVPLNEDNANEEKPKENKSVVVVEKANQEQVVIVEEPKEEEAGEEKPQEEQAKEEKPDQEQANEEKSKEQEEK